MIERSWRRWSKDMVGRGDEERREGRGLYSVAGFLNGNCRIHIGCHVSKEHDTSYDDGRG